jgi:hypothetical protein
MRLIPTKALLLFLLTLAGCLHKSTDAAVLAPLAQLRPGGSDNANQPQCIIFGDELTANVFRHLKRDSRYRIVSGDTRLGCASREGGGIQVYQLRVRVDKLMSDSALATMERTSAGSPGTIVTGEHILLVRRAGKWTIDRIIDGFSMIAM